MSEGDHVCSTSREAKVRAEDAFGERLRGWITAGGAKFVDVARGMGIRRTDLYDALDGRKHVRAAWLDLLPPAVEIEYLRERAAHHGMELRAVAETDAPFSEVLMQVGAMITACGQTESDGLVEVDEAVRDIPILRTTIDQLYRVLSHRVRAVEERGLLIRIGAPR